MVAGHLRWFVRRLYVDWRRSSRMDPIPPINSDAGMPPIATPESRRPDGNLDCGPAKAAPGYLMHSLSMPGPNAKLLHHRQWHSKYERQESSVWMWPERSHDKDMGQIFRSWHGSSREICQPGIRLPGDSRVSK